MNRKEFFKTGGRLLILGGLATSTGYLAINKKIDKSCTISPSCGKCGRFSNCDLPQAKEVNNEQK